MEGGRKCLKASKSCKHTSIFENMRQNYKEDVITRPYKNLKTDQLPPLRRYANGRAKELTDRRAGGPYKRSGV